MLQRDWHAIKRGEYCEPNHPAAQKHNETTTISVHIVIGCDADVVEPDVIEPALRRHCV